MSLSNASESLIHFRVIENIDRGVVAIDQNGRITLFNPTAQAFTGISEKQALGRLFEELFVGQKNLLHLANMAIKKGRSISDHEDFKLKRPSAPPLPVGVSVSPLFNENGASEGAVLIIRDLTRVRDLEKAVRRADQLSLLGILAAGLAHEIKNPLGGIKGATQLLAMELPELSPLREYTEVMLREVERVNDIIEELMDLSRPRELQWTSVNLAKVLGDIVLLQREAHRDKDIEFLLELDPSIPPLRGDELLLPRLFLNLIKNAAEAIEKTGVITVTSKITQDFHLSRPNGRPVPMVVVEVRDNGRGIAPEILEQIFTPFYTTKLKGSGLGLATCQKIVSEHEGLLQVDSVLGEGTKISVSLPLFIERPEKEQPPPA